MKIKRGESRRIRDKVVADNLRSLTEQFADLEGENERLRYSNQRLSAEWWAMETEAVLGVLERIFNHPDTRLPIPLTLDAVKVLSMHGRIKEENNSEK